MRRASLALILLTACAAAGCTSVSPSTATSTATPTDPAAVPRSAAPAHPGPGADRSGGAPAQPPHAVLETAGAKPPATSSPSVPPAGGTAAPPHHGHRTVVPRPQPRPKAAPRATALPGGTSVCDLGESYGGWAAGSPAATICRQNYGR
ncbi:hypothetical protein OG552_02670 [Streptomyces sp. NBC_01476]|uniref:hypothetical protein n=1 Tax=Streptomyces sp. NBC_01476 TaxID=2903881 RepID=UPI002E363B44|nr:hypothetical protein [Streptomyces sp. NBC_01476]